MGDVLNAILELVQNLNRKSRYKELVRIPNALPGVLALYNEICFNSLGDRTGVIFRSQRSGARKEDIHSSGAFLTSFIPFIFLLWDLNPTVCWTYLPLFPRERADGIKISSVLISLNTNLELHQQGPQFSCPSCSASALLRLWAFVCYTAMDSKSDDHPGNIYGADCDPAYAPSDGRH